MTDSLILTDVRGDGSRRTGLITLNRPKQLNALNDALMDQMGIDDMKLKLEKLEKEIGKLDAETVLRRVDGMKAALEAAQAVAITPAIAPVADEISRGAGFKDQNGQDPNLPQPEQAMPAEPPMQPPPGAMQPPIEQPMQPEIDPVIEAPEEAMQPPPVADEPLPT
mgnify:CR=1 FL=1